MYADNNYCHIFVLRVVGGYRWLSFRCLLYVLILLSITSPGFLVFFATVFFSLHVLFLSVFVFFAGGGPVIIDNNF